MSAPEKIPAEMLNDYTLNGAIAVEDWYMNDTQTPSSERVFTAAEINELIEKANRREMHYYGDTDSFLYAALDQFPVRGQNCVVMGTTIPWYESICLAYGAAACTCIEYWKIRCEHPSVTAITPDEYDKNPMQFDAGFSISSFEHDGLGRYGDPLNPNGDLIAMRKMKSIIKKDGLLYLALPVAKDKLVWNAHRIYGRHRLPLLLQGWQVVGAFGFSEQLLDIDTGKNGPYQPVFVLKNI